MSGINSFIPPSTLVYRTGYCNFLCYIGFNVHLVIKLGGNSWQINVFYNKTNSTYLPSALLVNIVSITLATNYTNPQTLKPSVILVDTKYILFEKIEETASIPF